MRPERRQIYRYALRGVGDMNQALAVQETALTVEEDRAARQLQAVKQIILQQTPDSEIRTRKGRGGMVFKYTDGPYVIRTLNAAFGHRWSFEADNEQIIEWQGVPFEVKCRGKLTVPINGETVTKVQYGSMPIEFVKDRQNNIIVPVTIGDAFKGAATDAMKKCASLLGVALDLYDSDYKAENYIEEEDVDRGAAEGMGTRKFRQDDSDPRPKTLGDIVSPAQLALIQRMSKEQGLDADAICRAKFGSPLPEIGKRAASAIIDQLKANVAADPDPPARAVGPTNGPSRKAVFDRRHSPEIGARFDELVKQLTIRGMAPDELLREANVALHDSGRKQIKTRYEADDDSAKIICATFEAWITILDRKAQESRASQV